MNSRRAKLPSQPGKLHLFCAQLSECSVSLHFFEATSTKEVQLLRRIVSLFSSPPFIPVMLNRAALHFAGVAHSFSFLAQPLLLSLHI